MTYCGRYTCLPLTTRGIPLKGESVKGALCASRWDGMATPNRPALVPSEAALSDIERLLSRLCDGPAQLDALLCAVELYGDMRADEARGA